MRDWIEAVKKLFNEADLFGNDDDNNVIPFPKQNKPISNIAVARGGADIHKMKPDINKLDPFTRSYIAAALWSSTDDDGNPLDSEYGFDDIHVDTLEKMIADCAKFQKEARKLIYMANKKDYKYDEGDAGHDFWLTRNGHGVGFWDRGLGPIGDKLTELAKKFREMYLIVEDGVIYGD